MVCEIETIMHKNIKTERGNILKQIKVKRIYTAWDEEDGKRILVDRLWPRGIKKEDAKIDFWPKALTPSNELRKWYQHDEQHWQEFKQRYLAEIETQPESLQALISIYKQSDITLLTASKHEAFTHVEVLKEILEQSE